MNKEKLQKIIVFFEVQSRTVVSFQANNNKNNKMRFKNINKVSYC